MDKFGRVMIPSKLRKGAKAKRFALQTKGEAFILTPIPTLLEAAGTFKVDFEKFKKQHNEDKDKDG